MFDSMISISVSPKRPFFCFLYISSIEAFEASTKTYFEGLWEITAKALYPPPGPISRIDLSLKIDNGMPSILYKELRLNIKSGCEISCDTGMMELVL
jgi:hypothetical protein